jgi:hypothetical protein
LGTLQHRPPSDAITDIIPLDDHTILAAAGLKD